jgi:hypothetical protein
MSKKKRLPIQQLREAGRVARQMLVERGILSKNSIIDEILKEKDAPKLPGIPAYLPHQWTIQASQRIMRDLLVVWKAEVKGDQKRAENITEFYKFVIQELRAKERKYQREVKKAPSLWADMKTVPVLKDVFSPMRKKEGIRAISRFFIDSFAVAVALKNINSTSEYANWFLDWTQDLYVLWVKPDERDKMKRV